MGLTYSSRMRYEYLMAELDSGTRQWTDRCRPTNVSNCWSLMTNLCASCLAVSPEFSPSISRHWNTCTTTAAPAAATSSWWWWWWSISRDRTHSVTVWPWPLTFCTNNHCHYRVHQDVCSLLNTTPRGLRGCKKNRPAAFPGRMSYEATKPGSVCPLS